MTSSEIGAYAQMGCMGHKKEKKKKKHKSELEFNPDHTLKTVWDAFQGGRSENKGAFQKTEIGLSAIWPLPGPNWLQAGSNGMPVLQLRLSNILSPFLPLFAHVHLLHLFPCFLLLQTNEKHLKGGFKSLRGSLLKIKGLG